VVECQLPKLDVAGSNPVSRSFYFFENQSVDLLFKYIVYLACILLIPITFSCSSQKKLTNSTYDNLDHYHSGLDYLKVGDWHRAELEFRLALEHKDSFTPAHFGLALLYYRKEEYKTADYHIDHVLKLKSNWAEARLLKGKILYKKEEYHRALDYFDAGWIIKSDKSNKKLLYEALLWTGLTYQQIGEMTKAGKFLEQCLKFEPQNQEALKAMQYQKIYESYSNKNDKYFKKILLSSSISRREWAWLLSEELNMGQQVFKINAPGALTTLPADVPTDDLAANQILQTLQENIFFVFPDGTFKPDRALRRAEIAITYKNLKEHFNSKQSQLSTNSNSEINDLPDWHPLYSTVNEAIDLGLLQLDQNAEIQMNGTVSGKEAIIILYKLKELLI
jgi:Tfp pilus assembly protein PilF